nr:DUF1949 domain-containing protein [Desulfuromonadales bacterium]NIS40241.1 DUF1949 domain-containing protein [Desulfuromonadales bacterium]
TLLHSGIGEIAVVVTRYFGGAKLGKGGLVRAYTQAVQEALKRLPLEQRRSWTAFTVRCDYPELEKTKMLIDQFDGEMERVTYEAEITLEARIPDENAEEFAEGFRQATCGAGNLSKIKVWR